MGGHGCQGSDPAKWIFPIVLKLDHVSSRVALWQGDQQRMKISTATDKQVLLLI